MKHGSKASLSACTLNVCKHARLLRFKLITSKFYLNKVIRATHVCLEIDLFIV